MLNVGPTADGEFPAAHLAILEAVGPWVAANAEAIYGTRPTSAVTIDEAAGYAVQSKDGSALYVYVVAWPEEGKPLAVRVKHSGSPEAALLNQSLGKLRRYSVGPDPRPDTHLLGIDRPDKLDAYATVVKVTFEGAKEGQDGAARP